MITLHPRAKRAELDAMPDVLCDFVRDGYIIKRRVSACLPERWLIPSGSTRGKINVYIRRTYIRRTYVTKTGGFHRYEYSHEDT